MNLLSLEQAQKSYGEKVLLKQANFYLNEGEKVGIIGINGTGKTIWHSEVGHDNF